MHLWHLLCLLPLLSPIGHAAQSGDFTYEVVQSTVTITKYAGPGGSVTIPATIDGLPVTGIGTNAFYHSTGLTNVTLPNGVTSVAEYAFADCSGLTTVTIGKGLASIGNRVFWECAGLANIAVDVLNPNYCDREGVLFNKEQTTLIQYPIARVGNYDVPNSVTNIGSEAFRFCAGLTSVSIGEGLTSIGERAFWAAGLANIAVDVLNPNYCDREGVLFNKEQTTLIQYPIARVGNYDMPNSVTSIGDGAFFEANGLTGVTMSSNVTTIGDSAFADCGALKSATLPKSLTSIGGGAFRYCTGLTSITLPNEVTSIGEYAFSECTGLTGITLPTGLISIGNAAFLSCTGLTSITLPNHVINIGNLAFSGCSRLTKMYFTGNAPTLGESAFYASNGATVYYLPGTSGWGSTFGGRPTMLWNSQVQTTDALFGVRTGQFGFTLSGSSNLVLVVEACTDLSNPAWSPVGTKILTDGSSYFSDSQWTNYPARFYRLRSP